MINMADATQEPLDLLIVEDNDSIGDCQKIAAEKDLGLTVYHTTLGDEAMELLKARSPDNLPKGVMVKSRLTHRESVDWPKEIFQYLKEQGATENFRYTCMVSPEQGLRERELQRATGAEFLVHGADLFDDPIYHFMAGLAEKKD